MARIEIEADVSGSNLARLATEVEKIGIPWLDRLRESALDRFETLGLPSTRVEEWRQTDVAPIAATSFARASASGGAVSKTELSALPLAEIGCPRIVLVNGRHAPDLSEVADLPSGIQVESLAAVLRSRPGEIEPHLGGSAGFEDRAFTALNTAFCPPDASSISATQSELIRSVGPSNSQRKLITGHPFAAVA